MSAKQCFMCDQNISGKIHILPSYCFKSSKKLLVERLASMLSDRMVLVCRPDDVICQPCVDKMEMLERLENMAEASRKVVHKFLDKKFSVDSEYLSSSEDENKMLSQGIDQESVINEPIVEPLNDSSLSFAERKRKSQQQVEILTKEIESDPRSKILLECNKCHYTTNYMEFESRHLPAKVEEQKTAQIKPMILKASQSVMEDSQVDMLDKKGEEGDIGLQGALDVEQGEETDYQIIEIQNDVEPGVGVLALGADYHNIVVWQDNDSIPEESQDSLA